MSLEAGHFEIPGDWARLMAGSTDATSDGLHLGGPETPEDV